MARFWAMVAFMPFCFAASCEKNEIFADASLGADVDVEADAVAHADASVDIGNTADDEIHRSEDDGVAEDVFRADYPDISGAWTFACQSDLVEEVNFNLHFFFFQDGNLVEGAEGESEDAYCRGAVRGDGQTSLTMEEPCTGSRVTFTGNVAGPAFMNGRYFWEWTDAFGVSHHDEGVWYADPPPEDCSPYPDVAGDWTLTYENGRVESATITFEQIRNVIRGRSPDGCEYLGVFGFVPECDDLRIYRRCPDLAGQTRVLFGILHDTEEMSGSWYDMNDTFGCPEIKGGSWSADRP
ncbi:MAG: hypothetical protein ABII19_01800 [Patescibacteria group bacterium]